jgi:hypothetical protein
MPGSAWPSPLVRHRARFARGVNTDDGTQAKYRPVRMQETTYSRINPGIFPSRAEYFSGTLPIGREGGLVLRPEGMIFGGDARAKTMKATLERRLWGLRK